MVHLVSLNEQWNGQGQSFLPCLLFTDEHNIFLWWLYLYTTRTQIWNNLNIRQSSSEYLNAGKNNYIQIIYCIPDNQQFTVFHIITLLNSTCSLWQLTSVITLLKIKLLFIFFYWVIAILNVLQNKLVACMIGTIKYQLSLPACFHLISTLYCQTTSTQSTKNRQTN